MKRLITICFYMTCLSCIGIDSTNIVELPQQNRIWTATDGNTIMAYYREYKDAEDVVYFLRKEKDNYKTISIKFDKLILKDRKIIFDYNTNIKNKIEKKEQEIADNLQKEKEEECRLKLIEKYKNINSIIGKYNILLTNRTFSVYHYYSGKDSTLYNSFYIKRIVEFRDIITQINDEAKRLNLIQYDFENKSLEPINEVIYLFCMTYFKKGNVLSITKDGVLFKNKDEIFHIINLENQNHLVDGSYLDGIFCYVDGRYQYASADNSLKTVRQYKALYPYKYSVENKQFIDIDIIPFKQIFQTLKPLVLF